MRLMKKCAAVLVAMIIAWSAAGSSAHAANKTVGDDEEIITATGAGWGYKGGNVKDSFYKTYARQAARLDAIQELIFKLLVDYKVKDIGQITVEKINGNEDSFELHLVSKALKNVWQVGEEKWEDNGMVCEVTMATTVKIPKN